MRCFVVAGFLLTSACRGPSAIAEPLVLFAVISLVLTPWQEVEGGSVARMPMCLKSGQLELNSLIELYACWSWPDATHEANDASRAGAQRRRDTVDPSIHVYRESRQRKHVFVTAIRAADSSRTCLRMRRTDGTSVTSAFTSRTR